MTHATNALKFQNAKRGGGGGGVNVEPYANLDAEVVGQSDAAQCLASSFGTGDKLGLGRALSNGASSLAVRLKATAPPQY